MRSVCADISTFVVSVDGEVQSHQFDKVLVLGEAQLVGEVVRIVLVLLYRRNFSILEDILIDSSGDGGELGDDVHGILESVGPVVFLIDTFGVCF